MKKLLLVFLLLALAGGAIGYYLWNKPHKSVAGQKADFTMTAAELLEDFQEDENAANVRYLGKIIELNGTILEIIPGEGLQMQVILETGDVMSRVSCVLEDGYETFQKRGLKKGDTVTIKGFCSGMTMDIILDRCMIVES